jgi:hypothetical protein
VIYVLTLGLRAWELAWCFFLLDKSEREVDVWK